MLLRKTSPNPTRNSVRIGSSPAIFNTGLLNRTLGKPTNKGCVKIAFLSELIYCLSPGLLSGKFPRIHVAFIGMQGFSPSTAIFT